MLTCAICEQEVEPRERKALLVEGWIEERKGGGAHSVRLAKPKGPVAHLFCIAAAADRARRGDQLALPT